MTAAAAVEHHRVVIIGAGFGGIGASVQLAAAGIEHVLLEKADDVGGTWLANQYPGCRCDVPSHLYSFSFAPNPDWSNSYSPQPEIWRYLRRVAEEHGVVDRVRFGCKVDAARWDDGAKRWLVETSQGTVSADVLISAHGFLSEPAVPHFDGVETFGGQVMHSAQWDPSYDVRGKRVAVIGTGASAVQIVPQVHEDAERLFVFQRTAAWIVPHRGRAISSWERALYRRVPLAQRLVRNWHYWTSEFVLVPPLVKNPVRTKLIRKVALKHLEAQVSDPELRRKLTPTFLPGCKRLTPSNDYLPAIASPTTTLVTAGIERFAPEGIVTVDGTLHEVDVIILATGFRVTDNSFPELVTGRDGRTLRQVWDADGMGGYNGTAFAGFPNFFMLAGPNTGIGHTSLVYMIEAQLPYIVQAVRLMGEHGIAALDVRPDVEAAYNEEVQRKLAPTVWNTGGCASWYLDKNGRNPSIWPDFTFKFAQRLKRFDVESYYQELAPRGS
ncbi:MAG TPA: NAD(P)/FAD-dependent oxidoreductase [Mycobacteriales bacterium]|nr:NAD(P)/FAD-dependent oxidoreductase [Mycobacteriales bacterium]